MPPFAQRGSGVREFITAWCSYLTPYDHESVSYPGNDALLLPVSLSLKSKVGTYEPLLDDRAPSAHSKTRSSGT